MGQEIERKFLLSRFPEEEIRQGKLAVLSRKQIDQTYLAFSSTEEVRIRRLAEGDRVVYTHTFKRGNGLAREEIEYDISQNIYEQLLGPSGKTPLKKVRTSLESGDGLHYDIDEYKPQFDLTVVEVEFPDIGSANRFTAPDWFGRELGSEEEYRNKRLWLTLQQPASGEEGGDGA